MTSRTYATIRPGDTPFPYLTAGRQYEVLSEGEHGDFRILNDHGYECHCLWANCSHLNGGDWLRVTHTSKETEHA